MSMGLRCGVTRAAVAVSRGLRFRARKELTGWCAGGEVGPMVAVLGEGVPVAVWRGSHGGGRR